VRVRVRVWVSVRVSAYARAEEAREVGLGSRG
jgi:hypothetical protein